MGEVVHARLGLACPESRLPDESSVEVDAILARGVRHQGSPVVGKGSSLALSRARAASRAARLALFLASMAA